VREYETTIIIQPEISDEGSQAIRDRLDGALEKHGALRLLWSDLGKRKLAYEIRKFHKGHYYILHYLDEGQVIPELERLLRIDESVLRFMSVQVSDLVTDIEARKAEARELEIEQRRRAAEKAAREAEEASARAEVERVAAEEAKVQAAEAEAAAAEEAKVQAAEAESAAESESVAEPAADAEPVAESESVAEPAADAEPAAEAELAVEGVDQNDAADDATPKLGGDEARDDEAPGDELEDAEKGEHS